MCASMNPGITCRPDDVELVQRVVVAEPGDRAVDDRDVGLQPLAREHREHAAAAEHQVRRLVAASNRQPAFEIHDAIIRGAGRRGIGRTPKETRGNPR